MMLPFAERRPCDAAKKMQGGGEEIIRINETLMHTITICKIKRRPMLGHSEASKYIGPSYNFDVSYVSFRVSRTSLHF